jgi:very-short-patch-repair endonuclease
VALARTLRSQMSLPEVMLWQRLQHGDVKFRRQHPVGRYVLDFFCASARLCVEVDGVSHDMGDNPARDAVRDAWLERQGVTVVRLAAPAVLRDPDGVAEGIVRLASGGRV